jgi:aspartate kinase
VGTGFTAGYRVLREVRRALEELGSPPRASASTALRVTAYCDEAVLPDAVRLLHARLIEGAG